MARTLTAAQQSSLTANPFRAERLIEIITPDTTLRYTTGQIPVSIILPDSTTGTFESDHGLELLTDINELYDFGVTEVVLQIGDLSDVVYDDLVRASTLFDFTRTQVNIYLLFRDVTTTLPYANDYITLFSGFVVKLDVRRTPNDLVINLRANNQFANFDKVNGRKTSSLPGALTADKIEFGV